MQVGKTVAVKAAFFQYVENGKAGLGDHGAQRGKMIGFAWHEKEVRQLQSGAFPEDDILQLFDAVFVVAVLLYVVADGGKLVVDAGEHRNNCHGVLVLHTDVTLHLTVEVRPQARQFRPESIHVSPQA